RLGTCGAAKRPKGPRELQGPGSRHKLKLTKAREQFEQDRFLRLEHFGEVVADAVIFDPPHAGTFKPPNNHPAVTRWELDFGHSAHATKAEVTTEAFCEPFLKALL